MQEIRQTYTDASALMRAIRLLLAQGIPYTTRQIQHEGDYAILLVYSVPA